MIKFILFFLYFILFFSQSVIGETYECKSSSYIDENKFYAHSFLRKGLIFIEQTLDTPENDIYNFIEDDSFLILTNQDLRGVINRTVIIDKVSGEYFRSTQQFFKWDDKFAQVIFSEGTCEIQD